VHVSKLAAQSINNAGTDQSASRSARNRMIRRALIALAIVALVLVALVAVHEITGWAGPWGSIEWLHSKATGESMALMSPTRWCWG
jgi:hypothetical protein